MMKPKNNLQSRNNETKIVKVPGQVTTAIHDIPLPYQLDVSEAANNINIRYVSDQQKFVPSNPVKIKDNKHILASHWKNGPLVDGDKWTKKYSEIMFEKVHNYDLQNHRSWFLLNQELLLLKTSEETHRYDSDWLIANYKTLCSRLIEYYYQYYNASILFISSHLNFLTWAVVDGHQDIGRWKGAFKFSDQMSAFTSLDQWVFPVGVQKHMIYESARARGKLANKTEVTSICYWRADIWGNVANHSIPLSSLLTLSGGKGSQDGADIGILNIDSESLADMSQGDLANQLVDNMRLTISEYGRGTARPHDPRVENGSEICVQGITVKLNNDANVTYKGGEYVRNLIDNIKQTTTFWKEYLESNFQTMKTPGSKIRQFAVQDLGIFENSMSNKTVSDMIRKLKDVDINELYQKMTYKRSNQSNMATIVKFSPLFGGTNGTAFSDAGITMNLERYRHDIEDHGLALKSSLMYPRLSPTVFTGGDTLLGEQAYPLVINSIQRVGTKANFVYGSGGIVGPDGTLLDIATSDGMLREQRELDAIGISAEWLKDFISATKKDVRRENPDNINVPVYPLIDTTDPFQCGFNVIISYDDDIETNPWNEFYLKEENYDGQFIRRVSGVDKTINDPVSDSEIQSFSLPTVKTWQVSRTKDPMDPKRIITRYIKKDADDHDVDPVYRIQHILNKQYLMGIEDAFVFVGASLFEDPYVTSTNMAAGHPEFTLNTVWGEDSEGDPVFNTRAAHVFALFASDTQKVSAAQAVATVANASLPDATTVISDAYSISDTAANAQTRAMRCLNAIYAEVPEGNSMDYSEMLFSSMYDDVAPVCMDFPYTALILRSKGSLNQNSDMETSWAPGMPKIWNVFDVQSASNRHEAKALEFGMVNPALMWMWILTGFSFQPVYKDASHNCRDTVAMTFIDHPKNNQLIFTDQTLYPIAQFIRLAIDFLGSDDLPSIDLDSYCSDLEWESFKLSWVDGTPETSIVASGDPSYAESKPTGNNVNRNRAQKPFNKSSDAYRQSNNYRNGGGKPNGNQERDNGRAEAETALKTALQQGNDGFKDSGDTKDSGSREGNVGETKPDSNLKRNSGESVPASDAASTD